MKGSRKAPSIAAAVLALCALAATASRAADPDSEFASALADISAGTQAGFAAVQVAASAPRKEQPKDIQYVKRDPIYRALSVEVFKLGWEAVSRYASKHDGDFAIVLDVDETVLDNSQYQKQNPTYSDATWNAWVQSKSAKAISGAKEELLDKVRSRIGPRAHVVFITDRTADQAADTISNMRALGLFADGDVMLSKQDANPAGIKDTKDVRRACVVSKQDATGLDRCGAYGWPIAALFGDQLRDFMEICDQQGASAVRKFVEQYPFGKKYFGLPNPMYGQWQSRYSCG